METKTLVEILTQAVRHHQGGARGEAEAMYRRVLDMQPDQCDALHLLGMLEYERGRYDVAIDHIQRAIAKIKSSQGVDPGAIAGILSNLGVVLRAAGRREEAVAIYREAIELQSKSGRPADTAGACNNLGNVLRDMGQRREAEQCYRDAVRLNPRYPDGLSNLGIILAEQGEYEQALAAHHEAIRLEASAPRETRATFHFNMGTVLQSLGRREEAVTCYRDAVRLNPNYVQAHNNLGNAFKDLGQLDDALTSYREAVRIDPHYAEVHNNLGIVLVARGLTAEAVGHYREAIRLRPNYAEAHDNLAVALKILGQVDEAIASHREALRIKPDYAGAHNNLAVTLKTQGKLDEAIASYQEALRLRPDFLEARQNLAAAFVDLGIGASKLGQVEKAESWYREAIRHYSASAEAFMNLGISLSGQQRFAEADEAYDRALTLKPGWPVGHFNRSLHWLTQGQFQRGLEEYEWRCEHLQLPTFDKPKWDGAPLDGRTILVHAEQGFGDALQFIRFAPMVKARGGRVVLQCREPLAALMARSAGIDQVVVKGSPLPPFDLQVPLLSLPRIFGMTLGNIPATVPYLSADAPSIARWAPELPAGGPLRVGLAWQGNPTQGRDRFRSMPPEYLVPLGRVGGVRLISLQHGVGKSWPESLQLEDLTRGRDFDTFLETAGLIMNLDLVITVDTSVAHLAGGLGVPVWVALDFTPDWRYLRDRNDSPFYPTMRLFRQPARGDWAAVVEELAAALTELAAQRQGAGGMGSQVAELQALAAKAQETGQARVAVEHLRRALELITASPAGFADHDVARIHNNLGVVLRATGQVAEAADCYRTALRLRPGYAQAHSNLGNALENLQQPGEAEKQYLAAVRADPRSPISHMNLGMHWLLNGDLEKGWPEFDWRCEVLQLPTFDRPRWDGKPLGGRRILLVSEQGFGDTLQFVRYAAIAKERGGTVIVRCHRALESIVRRCPGVDDVVIEGAPLPEFDVQAPLLSMPLICGTTMESIPAKVPYLFADRQVGEPWRRLLPPEGELRVGLAWHGSPHNKNNASRSVPLAALAPLTRVPGVRVISLQQGAGRQQLYTTAADSDVPLVDQLQIVDLNRTGWAFTTFLETAAVILNLDLVISIDSAVAHLSGGLGVPVWVALAKSADWRYFRHRSDSPWYPTMRLFRQPAPGDWESVVTALAAELTELAARKTAARAPAAGTLHRQAMAEFDQGRPARAIELLHELLAAQLERPAAMQDLEHLAKIQDDLCVVQYAAGQMEEAVVSGREAVRLRPDDAGAHCHLGNGLTGSLRHDEAAEAYREAVRLAPDYADAHHNLGVVLKELGRHEEAEAAIRKAIQLVPDHARAFNSLGAVLADLGRFEEAAECHRRTIELTPDDAEAHNNLGADLQYMGRSAEAEAQYEKSLQLDPERAATHFNRALLRLTLGDFARGWPEFEYRTRIWKPFDFDKPRWTGSPLNGKTILLHAEQGFGDTLQFIRYAPLVKARGGVVIVQVPASLVTLIERCEGVDRVVAHDDPLPEHSVQLPLLSLPFLLGTDLKSIPAKIPYLFADPGRVEKWRQGFGPRTGLRVGLAWQGNPKHGRDRQRSIPLARLEPLARVPGVQLVSLQQGPGKSQLDRAGALNILNPDRTGWDFGTFSDTAALIENLDLVIAIDSAVAHLAGGLGVPVWVAVTHIPDWRWMLGRDDSPWYSTLRLFRQPKTGDWESVIQRLAGELAARVAAAAPALAPAATPSSSPSSSPSPTASPAPAPEPPRPVTITLSSKEALDAGLRFHRAGHLREAEGTYRQLLAEEPDNTEARHYLGILLHQRGQNIKALEEIRQATSGNPTVAMYHCSLGIVLKALGRLAEAADCYRAAVRMDPAMFESHFNLGNTLKNLGQLDEAIQSYRGALKINPNSADARHNLGVALADQEKPEEALECFQEVLKVRPDHVEAQFNMGNVLRQQKRFTEAAVCFRKVLKAQPTNLDAQTNLGGTLLAWYQDAVRAGDRESPVDLATRLAAAVAAYREVLRLRPNGPAHSNLGVALVEQGGLDEAATCFEKAIQLEPNVPEHYMQLAVVRNYQGRWDQLDPLYEKALELKPDLTLAHFYRGVHRLMHGDFERGWADYEWRLKQFRVFTPAGPIWDGSPIPGKTILLRTEQGLGDALQFIRYAPLVKQTGGSRRKRPKVIVECQEPLVKLLARCDGIDQVVARGRPLPAHDVEAPLLSLPHILGTRVDTIPAKVPYLSADAKLSRRWQKELGKDAFWIGLAWQGNPAHGGDRYRSMKLAQFEGLAKLPGVRLVSLQKGFGKEQIAGAPFSIMDPRFLERPDSLPETAALMKAVDLVVTVDTAQAHLAGALGVPVFVLLAATPDWRWLLDRDDSPWYPTMRLFRQARPGEWDGALRQLVAAVDSLRGKTPKKS